MKIKHLAFALTALVLGLSPGTARADDEVSLQFFYDTLSPMGEWVQVGDYGDCWHPNDVDEDWAPYTDGYWSYTDAGWTWVSYEDFGGVTYHYGRWVRTDEIGWCWVPDTEWGPAWVSWRNNEEAVGWAPLPPEAHWRASVGFSTWCDDTYDIGPSYYTFCPIVEFGAPLIRTVCYPRYRNSFFIGSTLNCTNISFNSYHNVVFCGGPNFTYINSRARYHVPSLKLVVNNNFNHGGHGHAWTNARNVGNTLQVYAPKVVNKNTTIINKPQITKIVNKTQVNHGWNTVKDQAERQKLRAQIKEQNKGLTAENAPAKPVKQEDLKVVPEKADPKAPSPVTIAHKGGKDRNGDGVPDNKQPGNVGVVGNDRNGDGVPDNQPGQGGNGKNKNAGVDRNGDGVPDNQPGQGGNGKNKNAGVDRNGDGTPDNQPGKLSPGTGNVPKGAGRDQNGDGIPDRPPGQGGNGPGNANKDRNGDGIPDATQGKGGNGNGGFKPGKDANGDGIPDKPKGGPGQGGLVPNSNDGNGQIDQHPKKDHNDAQAEAARRQAEQAERQRNAQAQAQAERQRQAERAARAQEQQRRQAEAQERAIEVQRQQQKQRQQDIQHERQQPQHQPQQIQPQRPPQPQHPPQQVQPQRPPQPQGNGGGGGQGKGKGKDQGDDDNKKKNR